MSRRLARNPDFFAGNDDNVVVEGRARKHQAGRTVASGGNAGGNPGAMNARLKSARTNGVLDLSGFGVKELKRNFMGDAQSAVATDEQWWEVVAMTEVRFSNNEIGMVDEDAFEDLRETVEIMLLDNNKLCEFPKALLSLDRLKKLNLSTNSIPAIPESLSMPDLAVLELSHGSLQIVPECISELHNLRILDLSHNCIRTFCQRLPTQLEKVQLNQNQIAEFNDGIFQSAKSLKSLDISNNQLISLPQSFHCLSALEFMDLRYNKLRGNLGDFLPDSVALDQILLGFNGLTSIESIGLRRAPNLTVLDVRENKISFLPELELYECAKLKILEISNNNIADLPAGLGYMKSLQGLYATGNPLRGIRYAILESGAEKLKAYLRTRGPAPAVIAEQEQAQQIGVSSKDPYQALLWSNDIIRDAVATGRQSGNFNFDTVLENDLDGRNLIILVEGVSRYTIEEEIDGVAPPKPVVQLSLASNQLSQLPQPLKTRGSPFFLRLCRLNLERNFLESIDFEDFIFLPSLQEICLRNNSIRRFLDGPPPSDLVRRGAAAFPNVRLIDLRQNSLRQIPLAISYHFPNLEELLVGYNNLQSDEPSLASLSRLKTLDLSNSGLTEFPDVVLTAAPLEYVNLENNAISKVPVQVALKPTLRTLLLSGNPQRTVRPHVVAEGSAAVLSFLRDRCTGAEEIPGAESQRTGALQPRQQPQSSLAYQPLQSSQPQFEDCLLNSERSVEKFEQITFESRDDRFQQAQVEEPSMSSAERIALQQKISELESRLENDFSLSNAQRFAMKKNLAKERSILIRLERTANK